MCDSIHCFHCVSKNKQIQSYCFFVNSKQRVLNWHIIDCASISANNSRRRANCRSLPTARPCAHCRCQQTRRPRPPPPLRLLLPQIQRATRHTTKPSQRTSSRVYICLSLSPPVILMLSRVCIIVLRRVVASLKPCRVCCVVNGRSPTRSRRAAIVSASRVPPRCVPSKWCFVRSVARWPSTCSTKRRWRSSPATRGMPLISTSVKLCRLPLLISPTVFVFFFSFGFFLCRVLIFLFFEPL